MSRSERHSCGFCARWGELRREHDRGLREEVEMAGRRLLSEHPEAGGCKLHWWFAHWVIGVPERDRLVALGRKK